MAAATLGRILVTGSSGFVGGHLLPFLVEAFPGVELFTNRIDVTDQHAVIQSLRETRPDACIHLAAISSITGVKRDQAQAWRVNLDGTLNLARALLAHAPDCSLIFASSAEIYGRSFQSGHALDETALLAPMNSYAATKAAADLALGAMANDGLRVVRLRLFNHTGAGQSEKFVVPAFARQIARIEAGRQEPVLRAGNLESSRDFLDVRDVCGAYVACLRSAAELRPGTIINIASHVPRRIGDILNELLSMACLRIEVGTDHELLRGSEVMNASGDARLARELLGWTPKTPWTQTLADVLADWRKLTADDTSERHIPQRGAARD